MVSSMSMTTLVAADQSTMSGRSEVVVISRGNCSCFPMSAPCSSSFPGTGQSGGLDRQDLIVSPSVSSLRQCTSSKTSSTSSTSDHGQVLSQVTRSSPDLAQDLTQKPESPAMGTNTGPQRKRAFSDLVCGYLEEGHWS